MKNKLTVSQANFIKDILKVIGKDDSLNESFATALGMEQNEFDEMADAVFAACENGRLTVEN